MFASKHPENRLETPNFVGSLGSKVNKKKSARPETNLPGSSKGFINKHLFKGSPCVGITPDGAFAQSLFNSN